MRSCFSQKGDVWIFTRRSRSWSAVSATAPLGWLLDRSGGVDGSPAPHRPSELVRYVHTASTAGCSELHVTRASNHDPEVKRNGLGPVPYARAASLSVERRRYADGGDGAGTPRRDLALRGP
jgi:hypothetical protein